MAAADFCVGTFVDVDSITAVSADALIVDGAPSDQSIYGLLKIPYLLELAQAVNSTIKINLIWAVAYNCIAMVLSTGVLYRFGLTMNPYDTHDPYMYRG